MNKRIRKQKSHIGAKSVRVKVLEDRIKGLNESLKEKEETCPSCVRFVEQKLSIDIPF